ncbi:hypothetical protein U1Q18_046078 [Sarracenia purpurea var. burkii]
MVTARVCDGIGEGLQRGLIQQSGDGVGVALDSSFGVDFWKLLWRGRLRIAPPVSISGNCSGAHLKFWKY